MDRFGSIGCVQYEHYKTRLLEVCICFGWHFSFGNSIFCCRNKRCKKYQSSFAILDDVVFEYRTNKKATLRVAFLFVNEKCKKDNRLGVLRFQGDYLYDKGENDELFHAIGYLQPIYKYILARKNKKVKKKIKKFFFDKKG